MHEELGTVSGVPLTNILMCDCCANRFCSFQIMMKMYIEMTRNHFICPNYKEDQTLWK